MKYTNELQIQKTQLHKCAVNTENTTENVLSCVPSSDEQRTFKDNDVHTLYREDRWYTRGMREAVHIQMENPLLNKDGGLRYNDSIHMHLSKQVIVSFL